MNHAAIYRAYPAVKFIDDDGAKDVNGNLVQIDQAAVDAVSATVAAEKALAVAKYNRSKAYAAEADPLFFKAQRGEATTDEWTAKVAEIKARFPYPGADE